MGRTNEIDRDQEDRRSRDDDHRPRDRRDAPRPVQDGVEVEVKGLRGIINNIVGDKGFGFVDGTNGVRYFFHFSVCLPNNRETFDTLREGTPVVIDGIKSPKGPRCEKLEIAA